jgi:hypothetical protein
MPSKSGRATRLSVTDLLFRSLFAFFLIELRVTQSDPRRRDTLSHRRLDGTYLFGKPPPLVQVRNTSSGIMIASLVWASLGLPRRVASRFSKPRITFHAPMPSVSASWALCDVRASITCSSCMRSSSSVSSMPMWRTSTKHDRIKASSSRFPSRKLNHCHHHMPVARSSLSRSWAACIVIIAEVPEFSQRGRSDGLRDARETEGVTRVVPLRPSKPFLEVFLESGEGLVSESLSSAWNDQNILPQASPNEQISREQRAIDEGNEQIARRIS